MQRGRLAVFPVGEAKEDWAIVRALSEALGKKLPYDNLAQVRARMVELLTKIPYGEVVEVEQELISEGLPESEV